MKITDLDEGIFDLFSRGSQASGLNNIGNMVGKTQADVTTVDRRVKELLDSGMPDPQIVQTLQREFGLNPRAATQQVNIVKATMEESDNFDLSPQQRKLANLGRVLMDQATTTKNDELANVMAKVGNELTNFGANFGPKSLKDLVSKTDVPAPVIQKLIAYGQKIQDAQSNLNKDHKDGGLDDTNDTDNDYGDAAKADAFAKSKMGEDKDLLDPLKGAYDELFGKQPKKEDPEKIALLQAMEKYKDDPAGLKAWLMKNRNIIVWLNTNDSEMLHIVKQRIGISETTSAGSVAAVATPVGGMVSRQPRNPDGTAKNALDQDNILSNGKPKKKKSSRTN